MIICAAIKINNNRTINNKELIVSGHRHGDCLQVISELYGADWLGCSKIQGFINHKGEFLDRKEALVHALECGQLSATNRWYITDHNIDELYSEDLY